MLLNEKGLLDIDALIVNNESFKKIIEDGIITEEEISEQSEKVITMLRDMEKKYSEETLAEIKTLLAESSVLYAIYNYYSLQNINE